MHQITVVIFWTCILIFVASWIFAMVNWILVMGERGNAAREFPDAFRFSTDMPGSSTVAIRARRFMRGFTAGIIALTVGAAVGIGSGILQ